MKKLELIEMPQYGTIICDNQQCVYCVQAGIEEYHTFIGKPCPRCGCDLLSQEDYDNSMRMICLFKRINRWFGWMAVFFKKSKKSITKTVHWQDGTTTIK